MRDKRQKFVELAEARVNRAAKDLRLIGNLSNRSSYEYTNDDIRKIFKALSSELEDAKQRFSLETASRKAEFSLSDPDHDQGATK